MCKGSPTAIAARPVQKRARPQLSQPAFLYMRPSCKCLSWSDFRSVLVRTFQINSTMAESTADPSDLTSTSLPPPTSAPSAISGLRKPTRSSSSDLRKSGYKVKDGRLVRSKEIIAQNRQRASPLIDAGFSARCDVWAEDDGDLTTPQQISRLVENPGPESQSSMSGSRRGSKAEECHDGKGEDKKPREEAPKLGGQGTRNDSGTGPQDNDKSKSPGTIRKKMAEMATDAAQKLGIKQSKRDPSGPPQSMDATKGTLPPSVTATTEAQHNMTIGTNTTSAFAGESDKKPHVESPTAKSHQ